MLRVANSTPMVDFESKWNSLRVKRLSKFDLPTPESPMMTTAIHTPGRRVSGEDERNAAREKKSDAPQAVAASDASGDELARRTFEQVVVVIVRPRRRHRQPVLCRRAGKVPGGAAQARVWQPCGKGGQAGAVCSGTRKTAVRCRMGAWRLPTAPAGPIRGAAAAPHFLLLFARHWKGGKLETI